MKLSILIICLLAGILNKTAAQDLPPPPANLLNLPKGSYIIPMDNTYQLNSVGYFNLKSYGLIVYLLNKGVKIKWIISSTKIKDGIDFTVTSDQVLPTSTSTGLSRSFKAGPFVVFKNDTAGMAAIVQAYYTANGLAGADRPNIYLSKANITVDQRYDLTGYIPKGAILTDGGNQSIHLNYMALAGVPSGNYTTSAGDNLTNCFGFASEPHNTNLGPTVDTAIVHIKKFVQLGGNFLAQCAADSNYENNPLGRFQSTGGMKVTNANIGTGISLTYPNPALSFSQFEGDYFSYDGASYVQNWQILGATVNSEHNHATGTGIYATNVFASVSKLKAGVGGLTFYINCHDFAASIQPVTINGLRMYMNAFLTPSAFLCNLPIKLLNFSAKTINGSGHFEWNVDENETGDHFELEKSTDGKVFYTSAVISSTQKAGLEAYSFTDKVIFSGKAFYRLKMVNKSHSLIYSKIVILNNGILQKDNLLVLENPVSSYITFTYNAKSAGNAAINLFNSFGIKVLTYHASLSSGLNSVSFSLPNKIPAGIYFLELNNNQEHSVTKVLKQ